MHIFEKNKLKMNGLYIVYNAGAKYEDIHQLGTMHLMEHMICKRLDNLQDEFTNRNIVFNAYTTQDKVVVFVTGLVSELNADLKTRVVRRLTDGVFADEDSFIRERSVVLQEYYNYFDDTVYGNILNYTRQKFNDFSVIGEAECIRNFSYDDALQIFDKYFKKPSEIIEVGKEKTDFSFVKYNGIEQFEKKLKFKNYKNKLEIIPESVNNSTVFLHTKKQVSKRDYPYILILNTILTHGLNSVLYQELREKRGLVYGVGPYDNLQVFSMYAITDSDNAQEVSDVMNDVIHNLDKYITQERFNDVINCNKIQLEIDKLFAYKHPKMLNRDLPSKFSSIKKFNKVTLEDVLNVGKKYFADSITVVFN